jgi:hypothetical protein
VWANCGLHHGVIVGPVASDPFAGTIDYRSFLTNCGILVEERPVVHSGVTNMTDRHGESKFVLHDVTVPLAINVVYGDDAIIFERTLDLGQILGPAREYHAPDGSIPAPFVAVVKMT